MLEKAVPQLAPVFMNVAKVHQLMLKLGHVIPRESGLRGFKVHRRQHGAHLVADEVAEFQHVALGKRGGIIAKIVSVRPTRILGPPFKLFLCLGEIKVGKEQRVPDNAPKLPSGSALGPVLIWTPFDHFAKHRQTGKILIGKRLLQPVSCHPSSLIQGWLVDSQDAETGVAN